MVQEAAREEEAAGRGRPLDGLCLLVVKGCGTANRWGSVEDKQSRRGWRSEGAAHAFFFCSLREVEVQPVAGGGRLAARKSYSLQVCCRVAPESTALSGARETLLL